MKNTLHYIQWNSREVIHCHYIYVKLLFVQKVY